MQGVVGFGALNLDKITFVDKIPGPDEEGFVRSVEWHPGGSAPNTVVGLRRLGVRGGLIGRLGDDAEGRAIREDLLQEGVEVGGVKSVGGRTGTANVLVNADGQRAILLDPGVNDEIQTGDWDLSYVQGFELVHMTSYVCRSSESSFRSQVALAQRSDVPMSMDPGQLYAERGLVELGPVLRRCRVFLPNLRELEILTGTGLEKGARKLLSLGVETVVVKMGMKGAYVTDGRTCGTVPAYGGPGLDTTGAGDAFNAGFLYGVLEGMELMECGKLGAKVAWFSVQKAGARSGLPTQKELLEIEDA
jgi:ribokinase